MVKALSAALTAWEDDRGVEVVILKAEGRAFCAGGDILEVYEAGRAGKHLTEFFADEYRLNAQINRFRKPYISLIDGICMGGGMGISAHGSHRVMTENAVFAMPEVGIGFFPDVGGSYVLPNLGSSFGMYLGLTGNKIEYGDALWSGIATHTVQAAYLPAIAEEIAESGDPGSELREFFKAARRTTDEASLHAIAKHFSLGSLQRHRHQPGARGSRRQVRRRHAGDHPDALSDQPACDLPRDHGRLDHVDGRVHEDGVPHPQPDARKPRPLRGHPRGADRQGLGATAGSRPGWRMSARAAVDAYFAPLPDGDLVL